ncbi:ABC transporter substrate-binding protein [Neptunomonas phycophila]|uniref:ABC transporter substrate-binding protein n=1 Tax=Neptunomonas phycophila TaxID=1572645 RepID=UPI0026E1FB27|nr:ABC transporter substrate-binding protein [Neptunomonas phycophila]MDO6783005.1 ABC transporter substrate-binding protein [Neptunomonas phycophila]
MINMRKVMAAGALVALSYVAVADNLPTAAVFDNGSLDTLAALGLQEVVVGVPKQGLPAYLALYNNARYTDVGGLKNPDIEAIKALTPSYILITGRQGDKKADLEAIGTVKQVGVTGDNYWGGLSEHITSVAALFHAEKASEAALADLKAAIDSAKEGIEGEPMALAVTHNNGFFSLRTEPVIEQLLNVKSPAIPVGVESQTRGARTFTPLSVDDIVAMKPDALFIIDRSAAIGNAEASLDVEALKADLAAQGGESINVVYLTPKLWYLSGNGLQSVRMQIEEVTKAL